MNDKTYNQLLGENLRRIRESQGFTQEEIANKVGFSRDVIIRIEKGSKNVTVEELYQLAKTYNKTIDELVRNITRELIEIKGIILAGGSGTRLYPATEATSKQLMCVYDKPMIYYPLSVLMEAGIKDILLITTPQDQDNFKRLLGDGSKYGINLSYAIQSSPDGLAQAFIIGKEFIGNHPCAMVLGDNIFYGSGLDDELYQACLNAKNGYATIFGYQVKDPQRFGIMELDKQNNVLSVEEKPTNPKSDYAITGLYFYPSGVTEYAVNVKPSHRGELEITTLNDMYLQNKKLKARLLDEGYSWFDTGTFDSLLEASNMIKTIESNRDSVICCPEKIGYEKGWLSQDKLFEVAQLMKKNSYGQHLLKLVEKEMVNYEKN